jgi:hypothetical protein
VLAYRAAEGAFELEDSTMDGLMRSADAFRDEHRIQPDQPRF